MAIVTISAQRGLRHEEIARIAARELAFELVTQSRLESLYDAEFRQGSAIPVRGYADVVTSMLARLAVEHHLLFCGEGGQYLFRRFPGILRVMIVAPAAVRAGLLMVDPELAAGRTLDRSAAQAALRQMDRDHARWLRPRFRQSSLSPVHFDVTLNAQNRESSALAEMVASAARAFRVEEAGLLTATAERQIQLQARMRLARLGVAAPGGTPLAARPFAHPSEEIFASLLDFYRIPWEYEPRSFPVEWDAEGRVVESFTPDFYLPEFDLYVEITTMKQSLVTRKNHKIRRLRELYPEVNVQVFYQKDFENLIFKYGLERTEEVPK